MTYMKQGRRKKTARVQLTFRCREWLRRKIEASARRQDISMNADVERRIERSFEQDEVIQKLDKILDLIGTR